MQQPGQLRPARWIHRRNRAKVKENVVTSQVCRCTLANSSLKAAVELASRIGYC